MSTYPVSLEAWLMSTYPVLLEAWLMSKTKRSRGWADGAMSTTSTLRTAPCISKYLTD